MFAAIEPCFIIYGLLNATLPELEAAMIQALSEPANLEYQMALSNQIDQLTNHSSLLSAQIQRSCSFKRILEELVKQVRQKEKGLGEHLDSENPKKLDPHIYTVWEENIKKLDWGLSFAEIKEIFNKNIHSMNNPASLNRPIR